MRRISVMGERPKESSKMKGQRLKGKNEGDRSIGNPRCVCQVGSRRVSAKLR